MKTDLAQVPAFAYCPVGQSAQFPVVLANEDLQVKVTPVVAEQVWAFASGHLQRILSQDMKRGDSEKHSHCTD